MKSPLPTAFAMLLVTLCATVAVVGTSLVLVFARLRALPNLADARLGAAVINAVILIGLLIYSTAGIVAGLRYRQERKTLNAIGWVGNALLLLAVVAMLGFSFRQASQARTSRRLGGPIKVVDQYQP